MSVTSWVVRWEGKQQKNRLDSPNPVVEHRCDSTLFVVGERAILEIVCTLISQRIFCDNLELTQLRLSFFPVGKRTLSGVLGTSATNAAKPSFPVVIEYWEDLGCERPVNNRAHWRLGRRERYKRLAPLRRPSGAAFRSP